MTLKPTPEFLHGSLRCIGRIFLFFFVVVFHPLFVILKVPLFFYHHYYYYCCCTYGRRNVLLMQEDQRVTLHKIGLRSNFILYIYIYFFIFCTLSLLLFALNIAYTRQPLVSVADLIRFIQYGEYFQLKLLLTKRLIMFSDSRLI